MCFENEIETLKSQFGDRLEFHVGDIRKAESLKNLFLNADDAILIRMAGLIHPKLLSKDFDRVNFRGTCAVIEEAYKTKIAKAVVISSNSPVGV